MQNYQIRTDLTTHTAEMIMASQYTVDAKAIAHNRPTQAPHQTNGAVYTNTQQ